MKVHLVDGTYELFRHFFAVPAAMDANGQDVGAVRGVLGTVLSMIERGATHDDAQAMLEAALNELVRKSAGVILSTTGDMKV